MNSAEKQEAIKAISMKILETVMEGKVNDSDINDIFEIAFDQLVQTCPVKGGSSQKLIPRRAASAGPPAMVSKLKKEVLEEVDRRRALPEIKTKLQEAQELEVKIKKNLQELQAQIQEEQQEQQQAQIQEEQKEKNARRKEIEKENQEEAMNNTEQENIERILCENKYKFGKQLLKNIKEKTRSHIINLILYLITAFTLYKVGFKVADPRKAEVFASLLTVTIAQLARDIFDTTTTETTSFFTPLYKKKLNIASRIIHREGKRQESIKQSFTPKPKTVRTGQVRGHGGRQNDRRKTRKVKN